MNVIIASMTADSGSTVIVKFDRRACRRRTTSPASETNRGARRSRPPARASTIASTADGAARERSSGQWRQPLQERCRREARRSGPRPPSGRPRIERGRGRPGQTRAASSAVGAGRAAGRGQRRVRLRPARRSAAARRPPPAARPPRAGPASRLTSSDWPRRYSIRNSARAMPGLARRHREDEQHEHLPVQVAVVPGEGDEVERHACSIISAHRNMMIRFRRVRNPTSPRPNRAAATAR